MTKKNRPLAVICAVLLMISQSQTDYVLGVKVSVAAAFCTGSFQFCDDFAATADPPTNFTEANGTTTWATAGGVLTGPTAGDGGLLWSTNTTTTDQYAIMQFVSGHIDGDTGLCMGTNNSSSNSDVVYYSSGKIWWGTGDTGCHFLGDTADCTVTPTAGQYMIAKKVGTATTRVVSVWITSTQPTGAPTGTATCTFTGSTGCAVCSSGCGMGAVTASACNCDTGSCTPSAATTGQKVGLFAGSSSPVRQYDNFAGGSP